MMFEIPRTLVVRHIINAFDERIARTEMALSICKHTKRRHQLNKFLTAIQKARERYNNELIELEGDT
ncbi:hypothetical protein [Metasolibacillus sp.]|uniref:hypothetical protein n=1 Tax=Metasolibacillus sp. TaxID=2703680 RepID=UPI0025F1F5E6|nr:hypothetical protein [Metasolibacillus sp.]MCT6925390.1 hypothetical protein [Metasolibacillus sp.]